MFLEFRSHWEPSHSPVIGLALVRCPEHVRVSRNPKYLDSEQEARVSVSPNLQQTTLDHHGSPDPFSKTLSGRAPAQFSTLPP